MNLRSARTGSATLEEEEEARGREDEGYEMR